MERFRVIFKKNGNILPFKVLDRKSLQTYCALHCWPAMLAVLLVQLRFSANIAAARDGFQGSP
jgi:hypothetical protein